jgi:hypothetical protein
MGNRFGWHSGTLKCKNLDVDQSLSLGSVNFGSVELDTILLNGRFATSTIAGAALSLGSTYTYGELIELRAKVTDWTGIGSSFKGMYLRAETTDGIAANTYGIRGLEVYGVSNITAGTDGLNQICGIYSSAYVKSFAGSYTITYMYGIEANLGTEAMTALTTTQAACLYATLQTTTGLADYTKYHGIIVEGGNATNAKTYGNAIVIQDPTWSGCGATTWTTGLKISEACITGIDITGACTRGIRVGTHDWGAGGSGMLTISQTDPLLQVAGKVTASNVSGVYACSYNQLALTSATQSAGASMFASWNELYITPATTTTLTGAGNLIGVGGHVEISGTVTTGTGNITALNGSLIIPATLTNSGVISGVQVDMILNNGYTDSGIIAAYAIGEHTDPGQNLIPIGFYMPYNACKRGLLFGAPYSSGRSGLKILTDDTTWSTGATCGIYFDDGGSALTAWGEGFTVGLSVLTDSTVATQTGWPYTAFFYKDIRANITSATNAHWPTVMINTSIASTKTLDGFDSAGVSSLHVSTDVSGTLAGGTCLSDISFGGNSTGSISGQWVYMDVRPGTNVANRTAFIKFYSGSGAVATSAGNQDTAKWIKVLWDNTVMKIPLYATS